MQMDEPYQKITLDFDTKMLLENEFISDRLTFLLDNAGKTEKDFIEEKIESINFQIKERQRKANLSDNEFYQEFRREGNEDIFNNNGNETENIKEFIKERHSYHKVYYHHSNYIDLELIFYNIKLNGLQKTETKPKSNINNHSPIFSNNGFELFNYILENHIKPKGKRGRYADLSFYYWCLFNDEKKYIHQRPEVFKNWFCKEYNDSFEKIRTMDEVNDINGNRKKHYQTSLDWFKKQI